MAISKKISDSDFKKFENELIKVLKDNPEHSLMFQKMILFKSQKLNRPLVAKGVKWDRSKEDLVCVLTYGAASDGNGLSENFDISLKECYNDISQSSGEAVRLLNGIRQSIVKNYVSDYYDFCQSKDLLHNGKLNFKDFDDFFPFMRGSLVSLEKDKKGELQLICNNVMAGDYNFKFSKMPLDEIVNVGRQLERIRAQWVDALSAYKDSLDNAYLSKSINSESAALVDIYDKGFPLKICNSIGEGFAENNVFDTRFHTTKEICNAVTNFHKTGVLEIKDNLSTEKGLVRR